MQTSNLQRLTQTHREQLGIYLRMLSLAEEQAKCAESGNMAVFGEILERRDNLSKEVDRLVEEARGISGQLGQELGLGEINLSALRTRLPGDLVEPLAKVLAEVAGTIERIQTIDEQTVEIIQQVIRGIKGQMSEVQRGQVAMKAYKQAPMVQQARFIDKQK